MSALEPMEYYFVSGSRFPDSLGPLVGKEMVELRKTLGPGVTPRDVLAHAKAHRESAIGQCFDWDKDTAAEAHWLQEAGSLLRSLRVRIVVADVRRPKSEPRVITTRLMHHVLPDRANPETDGMVYLPASETLSSFGYRTQLLEQIWKEVDQLRRKAEQYEELHVLVSKLEQAYRETGRKWETGA